ncbi:MAG: hypothetical protein WC498_02290 [Candidatus Saccharimonadales bacterium]
MDYWYKQSDAPLFPELEWSRPENKAHAGKLLIVGGNEHGFSAPAEAYGESLKAGAGTVRIILPSKLHKTVGKIFPEAEYAPSTPSGSFASQALGELLDAGLWADAVLFAGNVGHNSETTVLLESFLRKFGGQATIAGDAIENVMQSVRTRPDTLLVLDFAQLQHLGTALHSTQAVTSNMDLLHLVEWLHTITTGVTFHIVTVFSEHIIVAAGGQVSTTKAASGLPKLAAQSSVWWLQNPAKPFEALTTAVYEATHS